MALSQLAEDRVAPRPPDATGNAAGRVVEFDFPTFDRPRSPRTAEWKRAGNSARSFIYDGVRASRSIRAGLSRRPAAYRPLPMEDVYFHIKSIDNSQVRRLPDPKSKAMWLQLVGAGVLGLTLLLAVLAPRPLLRQSGYRLEKLSQTHQRLVEVQDQLRVRQATLSDLRRVTALASGQGLAATPPERFAWQNRTIAPVEGVSELALNRGGRP